MPDSRVSIPPRIVRGEPFEVRVLIRHPMETGYRTDDVGKSIPRNVIRTFTCRYDGNVVFSARMSSGIAANPYLRFFVTATKSGHLVFDWVDDAGVRGGDQAAVIVA
jgi:thiosulfate oxidation carrier complex protein SoxZ